MWVWLSLSLVVQEDSDNEVIICFGTKFKLTGDLTVVESDILLGYIPYIIGYIIVINNLWNSIYEPQHVMSTMWHFDECRLKQACAASF